VLKDGIRRYIGRDKKELTTEAAEVRRENGEGKQNFHA